MTNEALWWRCGSYLIDCRARTQIMGILNVTPDSFSDGGWFLDPEAAVAQGVRMASDGADVLDVGGESTRPGAAPVSPEEERGRVLPVIKGLAAELDIPVSIDTRHADVATAALEAGATVVNDISGGADPGMFDTVAEAAAGMVLMHMRGDPQTMQQHTEYGDVVREVREELRARVDAAVAAGIEPERLVVDPGLGFAKTAEQNLLLMRDVAAFTALGRPVLAGPSRKSFIGKVLGTQVDERLEGTSGAVAWLAARGAHILRVHDVRVMVRVVRVVDAIRRAGEGPPG